jgi:membrane-bound lytic murein transglycosylase B
VGWAAASLAAAACRARAHSTPGAEAVRFCEAIADSDNRAFFAALWQEESAHGQELQEWLATFATAEALAEPQHASF